jgi:hypothetical protein
LALAVSQSSFAQPTGENPKGGPPAAQPQPGKPGVPRTPRAADSARRGKGPDVARSGGAHGNRNKAEGPGKRKVKGKSKSKGKGKGKRREGPSLLEKLQAKKDGGQTLTPEEKEKLRILWAKRIERETKRKGPEQEAFLALLAKAKDGKLSDDERAELSKLTTYRKEHRWLARTEAKRDKTRAERARNGKRKLLRRFPGVLKDQKARAELKKHAERDAMLERMLDLARLESNTALFARIKKLREKERARHDTWMNKHFAPAK